MPTIAVTADAPGAGKTGVATAIARHYAYQGVPTKLVRTGADERAGADARWFGSLDFVPGSPAAPSDMKGLAAGEGECLVVELAAGDETRPDGAFEVRVSRAADATAPDGGLLVAIGSAGSRTGIWLPDDRTLAGFDIDDVQALLAAEVLVEAEPRSETCDHLVIAPIGSDAGEPYFRRFSSFAVVVRFDRTDMHLAAIKGGAAFLILTGGRRPMDYLFDVAMAENVPVLLARTDTENTVIALEPVFDHSRFHGRRKLDRMAEMLGDSGLFDKLPAVEAAAR